MIRLETFRSTSTEPTPARAFVTCLQAIDAYPVEGGGVKRSISVTMCFYAETAERSLADAEEWLAAERQRLADMGFRAEEAQEKRRAKKQGEAA